MTARNSRVLDRSGDRHLTRIAARGDATAAPASFPRHRAPAKPAAAAPSPTVPTPSSPAPLPPIALPPAG